MESLKLTCYSGERRRAGAAVAGNDLLDLYATAEIAASIQLRGTQGSGLRQHLRSGRSLALSADLPLLTVAVTLARASRRSRAGSGDDHPRAGDPGARPPAKRRWQPHPRRPDDRARK